MSRSPIRPPSSDEDWPLFTHGALAGLLLGALLAALAYLGRLARVEGASDWWSFAAFPVVLAILGAMMTSAAPLLRDDLRRILHPVGVNTAKLNLPILGGIEMALGDPQRAAARRIFFEMATRTLTQPLRDEDGTLRAAIDSLHGFFGIVRDELKGMPPTPPGSDPGTATLESIGARMLNDVVRPYLSRWHPRLFAWESAGLDETDWPLAPLCREDLDRMRILGTHYAYQLAEAAAVPMPELMLPELHEVPDEGPAIPSEDLERFRELQAATDAALGAGD